MGASGDMLMSALWELVDDKQKALDVINNIALPYTNVYFEQKHTCGISGTYARVVCRGNEESDEIINCTHSTLGSIEGIINNLNVPDEVKQNSVKAYNIIANAESDVHNTDIKHIHFHELGTLDAVADVVICSYLLYLLNPEKIIVSPINVGKGTVKCAHGILPVPAPATALILNGAPVYSNNTQGELCTPTGAALIKTFADEYGDMPLMKVKKIGYGIGTKEFDTANCLRAFWGDAQEDDIVELACNIDDMTAEDLGYACQVLLDNGALDVYQTPVTMKKFRLATMLSVICDKKCKGKMLELIFQHTSTIGVREYALKRYTLDRKPEKIYTPYGEVTKKASWGYGISKQKIEYDDLKKIADNNNLSIEDVRKLISE